MAPMGRTARHGNWEFSSALENQVVGLEYGPTTSGNAPGGQNRMAEGGLDTYNSGSPPGSAPFDG